MAKYRPLEVTLISAKDLKNVNFFSKLEVYAVATLSGDPRSRQRTPADRDGRKNPTWNTPVRFLIPEGADTSRMTLDVVLKAERALGDREIGSVRVPVGELVAGGSESARFVSYQVRRPSGRGKGVLNFSYRFGDPVDAPPAPQAAAQPPVNYPPPGAKYDEPVTAYPVYPPQPHPGPSGAYPPPQGYPGYNHQPAYGYGAPPPGGYGYPPPGGYGYGAPPVVRPQQKPSRPGGKMGMGLGAGLLGGALGGLLLGDMISDVADYDAGYDAGFDDAGFDF